MKITDVFKDDIGVGGVVSLLWFAEFISTLIIIISALGLLGPCGFKIYRIYKGTTTTTQ